MQSIADASGSEEEVYSSRHVPSDAKTSDYVNVTVFAANQDPTLSVGGGGEVIELKQRNKEEEEGAKVDFDDDDEKCSVRVGEARRYSKSSTQQALSEEGEESIYGKKKS